MKIKSKSIIRRKSEKHWPDLKSIGYQTNAVFKAYCLCFIGGIFEIMKNKEQFNAQSDMI